MDYMEGRKHRYSTLSPRRISRRVRIVAVLFSITAAGFLGADQSRVDIKLGIGGRGVPRRWNPLWVSIDPPPERGRVELRRIYRGSEEAGSSARDRSPGPATASESFPLDASGRAECPIFLDHGLIEIEVSVRDGRRLVARELLNPWESTFPGHAILCNGLSAAARNAVAGFLFPIEPVYAPQSASRDFPSAALDYDAVGAVIIDGEALSLSPSQRDALSAFASGGGAVAVVGGRPERYIDLGRAGLAAGKGFSAAPFGLGRVVLIERGPGYALDSRDPGFWKEALALPPYDEARRLNASRFSIEDRPSDADADEASAAPAEDAPPTAGVAIAAGAWAAAASALLLARKRRLAFALAGAALSLAGLSIAGAAIDRSWNRGASAEIRIVALPLGTGALADIRVRGAGAGAAGLGQPRMIRVALEDAERGTLDISSLFAWRHEFEVPYLSVLSVGGGGVRLSGLLPAGALAGIREGALAGVREGGAALIIGKDGELSPAAAGALPDWALAEEPWMRSVAAAFPGADVAFGRRELPSIGFTVQGRPPKYAFWAEPVAAGLGAEEGGR